MRPHVVTQRRRLEERESFGERVRPDHRERGGDRALGPDHREQAHEQLGDVGASAVGSRGGRVGEVDDGGASAPSTMWPRVQQAVRDVRGVQALHLRARARSSTSSVTRDGSTWRVVSLPPADDEERCARAGRSRDDDLGATARRSVREQQGVGLVLDVFQPGQVERGPPSL